MAPEGWTDEEWRSWHNHAQLQRRPEQGDCRQERTLRKIPREALAGALQTSTRSLKSWKHGPQQGKVFIYREECLWCSFCLQANPCGEKTIKPSKVRWTCF